MLFSGTPETHLKRRLFILSQTKSCNPNCDTYEDKSDNMMIRRTQLISRKKIFYIHHETNLNHLSLLFPASLRLLLQRLRRRNSFSSCVSLDVIWRPLVVIVCHHSVSVFSVCFILRGWRFLWSLCCSGQLPRCRSLTVSTHTTGEDKPLQNLWEQ